MAKLRLASAGALIGIGLGAFFDGIVFHQLLQWHNMLSGPVPPTTVDNLRINIFWDGMFHAFAWIVLVCGLSLLWTTARRGGPDLQTRALVGAVVFGWGLFNLIEGTVNHHILEVHHVVHGDHQLFADLAFLASGAALFAFGLWLMITAERGGTAPDSR
jgi:uncharacterized membrane protein